MSISVNSKSTQLLMNGDWRTTMTGSATALPNWELYANANLLQNGVAAGTAANWTVTCTFTPGNPPLPTFTIKLIIDAKDWTSELVPVPPGGGGGGE